MPKAPKKKMLPLKAYDTAAETIPSIARRPFNSSAFSLCVTETSITCIGGSFANMLMCPRSLVVTVIVNVCNEILHYYICLLQICQEL